MSATAVTERTTVVVISHDYGRYLRQAVTSALRQVPAPRVLIMDDASRDDTWDVAQALEREAGGRVACVRSDRMVGLAEIRNTAARLIATPWVIYLDADDWLGDDFVARGEARLDRRPHVDVLTADMVVVRDGRRPFRVKTRPPSSAARLARANPIAQTSFIRRDIIAALGGYDGSLHFEDWDFWIRALQAGYTIERLPGARVFRREHGRNKSKVCDQDEARAQLRAKHGFIGDGPAGAWRRWWGRSARQP